MLDILDLQAQSGISGTSDLLLVPGRNDFEKDAINIEASDNIPRLEFEPQGVTIEPNGSFQVADVIEHAIEMEFHAAALDIL